MERRGHSQQEIITVLVGRVRLRSGRDQQEVYAEDGYEDTQRPEMFGRAPGYTRRLTADQGGGSGDLQSDYPDNIEHDDDIEDHDDEDGDPEVPGSLPEIHPTVHVVVECPEDSVRNH